MHQVMDKIRFGIVGTNGISEWFLRGTNSLDNMEVTAVCSRSMERGKEFALKNEIPYVFDSIDNMASSDKVDAIYIATPNYVHASQSIVAMSHGKHVLCEKPMASNAAEVEKMIEAAHKYNVVLMEAVKPTMTPNFRYLKENISRLGKIRRYFGSFCKYSSRYDSLKDGIVLNAFKPELSNGAVMDIGLYTIYPMIALFGKPKSIKAESLLLSTGVDGQGCAIFSYEDMDGMVSYSKIADSHIPSEIEGEDGSVIIRHINHFDGIEYIDRRSGEKNDWSQNQPEDAFYYEVKEFISLIKEGKKESKINSHANSLACMEVIEEIRRQTGVRFPADIW